MIIPNSKIPRMYCLAKMPEISTVLFGLTHLTSDTTELSGVLHFSLNFLEETEDPIEELVVWIEEAGKIDVGWRIMSLNGGTSLNPFGNLGTSGLQLST